MNNKVLHLIYVLLLLSSCSKNEELRFDNNFSGLNIWLGANVQKADSVEFNFAFRPVKVMDTIQFSVRLTGIPANADREFELQAIGGDTLKVKKDIHYFFPKYVLKAGTYTGVFPILIKRTADYKTGTAKIIFGLKENSAFKKGIKEYADLIVYLKDQFLKPANWDVDPLPYTRLSTFFGAYSNKKFEFITNTIGRPPIFKVRYSGVLVPPDEVIYTQAQYWQGRCKTELAAFNAANAALNIGPLRDENENLITFP